MRSSNDRNETQTWMAAARSRLAQRRSEKPATKAGQIRALWPEIAAALAGGQSLKSICKWLEEDAGITINLTSLSSYISRIRRRENHRREAHLTIPPPTPAKPTEPIPNPNFDPLANIGACEARRPGFHYEPATAEDVKRASFENHDTNSRTSRI